MTNALLFIMATAMSLFAILNLAVFNNPYLALFDVFAAAIPALAFLMLRKDRNIEKATTIGAYGILAITLIFTYTNQNHNFGLIWSIFLPLFVLTLKGPKTGIKITLFYYAIMLPMVFSGVGVWQGGEWSFQSAIRYSVASIALVFIVFMYERSLSHYHDRDLNIKRQLADLSRMDELTKLFNRRALNERLIEEYEKYYRYKDKFAVSLLDIDNFKKINDTFGHNVGDIVLKDISSRLSSELRKTEILGRWGGEEFLMIFPHTTADKALAATEKIRKLIENDPFTEVGLVTASFGIAEYEEGMSIEELLANADQALYEAKHTGKNKVVCYTEAERLDLDEPSEEIKVEPNEQAGFQPN